VPLSNVLIIKVLIVLIIHLFYYFSTAVTFILNCLFSVFFFSTCVIFVLCLCFCACSIIGPCAVKHNQLTVLCINQYKISRNCNRRRGFNTSDVRGCIETSVDLWLFQSAAWQKEISFL